MSPTGDASLRIDGRAAVITGASRGIGRAIAIGLARQGADILLHFGSDVQAAEATAAAVRATGVRVALVQQDLRVEAAGSRIVEAALGAFGRVDIVVLNASASVRRPWAELGPADIATEAQSSLGAGLVILQGLLPGMIERRWGRIVTIGSIQQVRPNAGLMVYAAMKSAMANVVVNLARQFGKDGITANNVAPGLIATDSTAPQLANRETREALIDEIPLGYVGEPEDVVGAVSLLCSDAGRYITGVDLLVDGGMHLPGRVGFIGADGSLGPRR